MDSKDLSGLTVYNDILTILKEKGFSDAEAMEIFLKLTAQAEMEVTEEMMGKLTDDQRKILEELPDDVSSEEITEKLNLDGNEIDQIRAKKTAELIENLIPTLDDSESDNNSDNLTTS